MAAKPYKIPVPHDRQTILCLHCNQPMEVGTRTINAICRHCGRRLQFEDVRVVRHEPKKRAVETYGNIVVEKRGICWADRIFCGSIVVRGKVDGPLVSLGPVLVGPKAVIKGDVTAPTLVVEIGAALEGNFRIGQAAPVGASKSR